MYMNSQTNVYAFPKMFPVNCYPSNDSEVFGKQSNDSVCKESTCFRGFDHFFPPYAYLRWHWGTHRVIFNRHLRDSRPNDSVCKESTCFRGFDHFFPSIRLLTVALGNPSRNF
ncbi:hypothetical protein TNCV_1120591 [Trichonephila clavipes]|uniref:Uncharacterized protein n=1 Tax=Trichonephila clavipes TaxID=2585209 RepID=A0A8X6VT24_TRICX|nr:hypothetical protein TNCV_1120591 [Trichonephila clavipes]